MNELNLTKYEILLLYLALVSQINKYKKRIEVFCDYTPSLIFKNELESDMKDYEELKEKIEKYMNANREDLS